MTTEVKTKITPFSKAELQKLVDENTDEAKAYIKRYFYKVMNPVCVYFNDIASGRVIQMNHDDFSKGYVTKFMTFSVIENKKVVTYKYSDWFLSIDCDSYSLTFDVTKPMTFTSENGVMYINLFTGFKYANDKPLSGKDIDEGIKNDLATHQRCHM